MILIDDRTLDHYWTVGQVNSIKPYGNGHINDTYLVDAENGHFILQRINKNVFITGALVSNFEVHVRSAISYQYENSCKITPLVLLAKNKKYHIIDHDNYAWRLIEFTPSAKSFNISPEPEVSYKAARAIGRFQLLLNTIKISSLQDTIKGFHNLYGRFKTFQMVIKTTDCQLLLKANKEIKQLMALSRIVEETSKLMADLPTRVIHNDTKLSNILFFGNKELVIDLDTVMPGKIMFDFGDMVRSYTSPAAEDDAEIEKTTMRFDHFKAIVKGYLEVIRKVLNKTEILSLLPGTKYIVYEQSIRFLTDYLQGNVYYKIKYPEHNLVRARTQLKLLLSIIQQESAMKKQIEFYA